MINPTRRNRNIGTAKQGYGQDNELVVPYPAVDMRSFFERLSDYKTVTKEIKGHTFKFIVEATRKNSFHACTIEDIEQMLIQIPKDDYGDLELIILRQPKRKEENLKPVWGRLIYSYEFENDYSPAVILEAVDLGRTFKWSKKLSIDSQKELERLKEDGHKIKMGKRFYEAEYELKNIRTTQLYRTLLHEFGHYVHYLEVVRRPISEIKNQINLLDSQIDDNDTFETNSVLDKWDTLNDEYNNGVKKLEKKYFSIPSSEKEEYAHSYAQKWQRDLFLKAIIPFEQKLNKDEIVKNGLTLSDFNELK